MVVAGRALENGSSIRSAVADAITVYARMRITEVTAVGCKTWKPHAPSLTTMKDSFIEESCICDVAPNEVNPSKGHDDSRQFVQIAC